ncbi:MAG: pectinesterase family protein [Prevotellaceae bacterium]|nr:pectinesterase family protein [Prevotellaceae bacterium]
MKKFLYLLAFVVYFTSASAIDYNGKADTLVVARDGTGQFRNIGDAIAVCHAFKEYRKVIYVKTGVYKEKVVIPSDLVNIEICGEDVDKTILTYDDNANVPIPNTDKKLGTSGSYTIRVVGNNITFKNITIENSAGRVGQAVALHTDGTRLVFINCRLLGNQDTVYTRSKNTSLYFRNCYIEGTTDFIFGASTVWFEGCTIHSKQDSYITAASTPEDVAYGYVFNHCKLTAADGVKRVFLGRPWRPFAYVLFMNCEYGSHILPEGWHNWGRAENEKTARYLEYNNTGEGSSVSKRVDWSRQLTKTEAEKITLENVFGNDCDWIPVE